MGGVPPPPWPPLGTAPVGMCPLIMFPPMPTVPLWICGCTFRFRMSFVFLYNHRENIRPSFVDSAVIRWMISSKKPLQFKAIDRLQENNKNCCFLVIGYVFFYFVVFLNLRGGRPILGLHNKGHNSRVLGRKNINCYRIYTVTSHVKRGN